LETDYDVERDDTTEQIEEKRADNSISFRTDVDSKRTRSKDGYQISTYDTTLSGLVNGV